MPSRKFFLKSVEFLYFAYLSTQTTTFSNFYLENHTIGNTHKLVIREKLAFSFELYNDSFKYRLRTCHVRRARKQPRRHPSSQETPPSKYHFSRFMSFPSSAIKCEEDRLGVKN